MKDKNISKIISQAQKLKDEEAKLSAKEKEKTEAQFAVTENLEDLERWSVYRAMFSRRVEFYWLLCLSLIPVPFYFYPPNSLEIIWIISILIAVPTTRWVYLVILLRIQYSSFKG